MSTHIQIEVAEYLKEDSGVANLVGTKIRPLKADQREVAPFIVYARTGADYMRHLLNAADLAMTTLELNCYGRTYGQANDVFEAVRNAMDGLRSADFGSGGDRIHLRNAVLVDVSDDWEEPADGSQDGLYVARAVFELFHTVATPTH